MHLVSLKDKKYRSIAGNSFSGEIMVRYAVGQAVPRTEDPRLLKGVGRYVDDIRLATVSNTHLTLPTTPYV